VRDTERVVPSESSVFEENISFIERSESINLTVSAHCISHTILHRAHCFFSVALFLHFRQDEIVPSSQMATLFAAATSSPHKEMAVFPTGKHNDTWKEGGVEYLTRVRSFLLKYAIAGSASRQRAAL
jgi:hypothetical protein